MTTQSTRFRQLLLTAVVALGLTTGANALAHPAIAGAERVWDLEYFDACLRAEDRKNLDPDVALAGYKYCCEASGGVFIADSVKCVAPPAEAPGTRSLPGNVRIPTEIATAPTLGGAPPPIRVPADVATASAATP